MVSLFNTMIEVALLSSFMIAVILLLRLVFQSKLSIKITMFFWLLVMLRLIVPYTIQSPIQIMAIFPERTKIENQISTKEISNDASESNTQKDDVAINQTQESNRVEDTQVVTVQAKLQEEKVIPKNVDKQIIFSKFSTIKILAILWLVGVFVSLIINIIWVITFSCKVKKSAFLSDKLIAQKIYNDCHKLNIGKNVSVYECDYVDSPITCGVFRPKILLPADLIKNVGAQKAELIIFHELIHIKNFDILKNYVWMIAKIIYWFNPLVYLGYNQYLEDVELYTDNTVKEKHSKQEILHYSQGLLDVIKLSQGEIKLPTAMPFCKTKIRKRVETMLKPQEKWKVATVVSYVVIILLIVSCFTTACMKEDKTLLEVNVDDAVIEVDEIEHEKNKEMEMEQEQPTSSSPQEDFTNAFDYWNNDDNTVTVDIDAEVYFQSLDYYPVAEIEKANITPELTKKYADIFFGNDVEYHEFGMTKDMYLQTIDNYNESATDMNSDLADGSGAKNLEELRKVADIQIEKVKRAMKNAPDSIDEIPFTDFDDVNTQRGLVSAVHRNGMIDGEIASYGYYDEPLRGYFIQNFMGNYERLDYTNSMPIDLENNEEEYQTGKVLAENLINDFEIMDVELSKAYLVEDIIWKVESDDAVPEYMGNNGYFHLYVFERNIGNTTADFNFLYGPYDNMYEKIHIWTKEDEVVQFIWQNPQQVVSVSEENTEIIDHLQAIEIMKQDANERCAEDSDDFFDHHNVLIERINLEFVTVDIDGHTSKVVPAWVAYGQVFGRITQECVDSWSNSGGEFEVGDYDNRSIWTSNNTLMCVNAIDGSIIELEHMN